jgi:hypothetical protein
MTFSIYTASVPVYTRKLKALLAILNKAEANATERKIDLDFLVNDRLAPDMLPLRAQVQMVTDQAKFGAARVTGKTAPSWADEETSFEQLKARLQKALDYLATFSEADFAGGAEREVTIKVGGQERTISGAEFLLDRSMPNFYFHLTTAYAILRKNGVPVGKGDFLA